MSISDLFRLEGRVAVVTGSGRGIGRAIALALADAGADVVVTARRGAEVAAVAEEVRVRRAVEVVADLRGDTSELLAARAVDEFGGLDVWVNNAGGTDDPSVRPLARTSDEQLRDMLKLNLVALLACVRAAAALLSAGGTIVNIASGPGMRGAPGTGGYGAAKAAVLNMTSTLAAELAPRGVRVNAVSPGMVPTETFFSALALTDADLPRLTATVPLGRLGTPEDMAAAVLYLASPAASWVTGQNLLVGGGRDGGRTVEDRAHSE